MRNIGFSTGALAKGDFRKALNMLHGKDTTAVELSALRQDELPILLDSLPDLDLQSFSYVSVHAPSSIRPGTEHEVAERLQVLRDREWPIIVHPDTITDSGLWSVFGRQLCIENTDLRKSIGRTASELERVFSDFPNATFCCDLGHARQVDPTMAEATAILQKFGDRLVQLHVSEVNTNSSHDPLSIASIRAFNKIYQLIPDSVPVILETPVQANGIESEIAHVHSALPPQQTSRKDLIEGSLDILWVNHDQPNATPEYRLHFLRYVGFKDRAQGSQILSGTNALRTYLQDLNVDQRQVQLIIDSVREKKFFDAPNVLMPKTRAIAYED